MAQGVILRLQHMLLSDLQCWSLLSANNNKMEDILSHPLGPFITLGFVHTRWIAF